MSILRIRFAGLVQRIIFPIQSPNHHAKVRYMCKRCSGLIRNVVIVKVIVGKNCQQQRLQRHALNICVICGYWLYPGTCY